MNRNGLRVVSAAVTAAFFACGAGQARIQPPSPASPKRSVAPKTPRGGAVSASASARIDRAVSEALAHVRQSDARTADALTQYTQSLSGRGFNGLPEKRQNIDLVDVPLKEALKRVLDDSKVPYVLDDDVPNEPKVSIKLTNAPLATILDALTLSNRIGWRTELKQTTTTSSTTKPFEPSDTVKGGTEGKAKAEKDAGVASSRTYYSSVLTGSNFVTQIHVGKTISTVTSFSPFRAVTIPGPPPSAAQDVLRGRVTPGSPQLRIYRWQTQKRTFTCPRCHN